MKNKTHQIKSSRYYLFWGIISAGVIIGQIYVGLGYRMMAHNVGMLTISLMQAIDPSTEFKPLRGNDQLPNEPVRKLVQETL